MEMKMGNFLPLGRSMERLLDAKPFNGWTDYYTNATIISSRAVTPYPDQVGRESLLTYTMSSSSFAGSLILVPQYSAVVWI
jgi:hypothetical protein